MTIDDSVEDYLIYAYIELDFPHRCYVGKTLQSRAEQRDQEHRAGESGAPKFNAFVQNEFIYGDRDFDDVLRYEVLEHFTGTAQECAEREGEHIQRKNSIENGWNLKPEGTGTGLLFPSTPPGGHGNRPQLKRSKSNIQGDLGEEIIQDAIEYGLEKTILEKNKNYNFQELKTLIAKSYVAHVNQILNLTVQEPAPDEIKSVLNDWAKLENSKDGKLKVERRIRCNMTGELKSSWYHDPNKWWETQLTKSGFERPFDLKRIVKAICDVRKADLNDPINQWLKGNSGSIPPDMPRPKLDRKWICYHSSHPVDVWVFIRSAFLAEFPNTLQEIEEKEEQARLQKEREEREEQERLQREREEQERQARLQREREERERQALLQKEKEERERREKERQALLQREREERERIRRETAERERIRREMEEQERLKAEQDRESTPWWERPHKPSLVESVKEAQERLEREREKKERFQRGREEKEESIGKVAERMEKERIQRVAQARPDLAIIEKQVTRAGSGVFGCIIFSIISIIFIICVLVSCIKDFLY